jgi:hypothetical protein
MKVAEEQHRARMRTVAGRIAAALVASSESEMRVSLTVLIEELRSENESLTPPEPMPEAAVKSD